MYVITFVCAAAIAAWMIHKGKHWYDGRWEALDDVISEQE